MMLEESTVVGSIIMTLLEIGKIYRLQNVLEVELRISSSWVMQGTEVKEGVIEDHSWAFYFPSREDTVTCIDWNTLGKS